MGRARLLVVDDRASVLELMRAILEPDHDVTTIPEPARAIALVERERFDLVLTDVRMPGADGFEVLAAVQRAARGTPVVMMTGFASVPDAVTAIKQGAFDYVVKPLDADDVRLVVGRALAERRAPAPAPAHDPGPAPGAGGGEGLAATQLRDALLAARERATREYLVALLTEFRGNVTHAADRAGMTRESLHRVLKRHGIRSEAFRPPDE